MKITSIVSIAAAILLLPACSDAGFGPRANGVPAAGMSSIRTGWMSPEAKREKYLLYVADPIARDIKVYKQEGQSQQPIGEIVEGISDPECVFVGPDGKLFVCNFANGTVTVYPRGRVSPSETLTHANQPNAVAVAADGTVYVANYREGSRGTVLEYRKGHTRPAKTFALFGPRTFTEGLAFDSKQNLYVSYGRSLPTFTGGVVKYSFNSRGHVNLGIQVGLAGGLAFDRNDNLLLVDQDLPAVDVFRPGRTKPSKVIEGFHIADEIALDRKNHHFWMTCPDPPAVYEVSYPAGEIVNTITSLQSVSGIGTSSGEGS